MRQHGLLRSLKAAELSDGTLRYLLLISALLSPRPPNCTGGRKESRRQAGRREGSQAAQAGAQGGIEAAAPQDRKTGAPRWRQPLDREGRRRRPGAGLYRVPAGLETRRRTPPRR